MMRRLGITAAALLISGAACGDAELPPEEVTLAPAPLTTSSTAGNLVVSTTTTAAPATSTTAGRPVDSDAERRISFNAEGCSSADSRESRSDSIEIVAANTTVRLVAVVVGTYDDGYDREDLVSYGPDISVRPDFITALEIFEISPASTRTLTFDHGPGTYFVTCLPNTNTMVVLDDLRVNR
jgi:hypothetical protein